MRKSTRRAELLGEFDLLSGVKIYLDAHDSPDAIGYTDTHESSHRKLASSTTYGQIQQLLATVLKEPAGRKIPWFGAADAALNLVLDASWDVDEGYAVFREMESQRLYNMNSPPSALPDEYAKAHAKITSPLPMLPDVFVGFEWFVVRALAEAAMNSTILDIAPFDDRFAETVVNAVRNRAYCPDERLALLTAALSRTPLDISMGRSIHEEVHASARKHGIEQDAPASELYRRAAARASIRNFDFLQELDERLTPRLEEALAGICPEVKFLSAEEAHQTRIHHRIQAQAYGARCGLDIPEQRKGSPAELAVSQTEVEYETSRPLKTVHLPHPEIADVAATSLAWEHEGFLITIAPAYPAMPEPWVCLAVMPLQRNPGTAIEADEWRFAGERLLLYGPATYAQRWCEAFRRHTVILLLHSIAVDHETWTADTGVQVLNPLPVCVIPYAQGKLMIDLLTRWKKLGVKAMIPLSLISERLLYLLVRLATGIDVVVRISTYLLGILQVHYPELFGFVSQSLRLEVKLVPPRAFLELLVKADLAGAFLPLRDTDDVILSDAPIEEIP